MQFVPTAVRARAFATCATLALAVIATQANAAGVCVDTSSPSAALDRRVASAAFAAAGDVATIVAYDGSHGVSEKYFRALAREECAVVMGFPVDAQAPDPPSGLKLTAPYYATGYVLATLAKPRELAALPHDATIAVGTATAPDFYLVGAFGHVPPYRLDVHQTQEQVLDALATHGALAAMAWGPSVERYRRAHPSVRIAMTPLAIPHGRWSFAALYDPRRSSDARRFERGLRALSASGRLQRLARSVFPEVSS